MKEVLDWESRAVAQIFDEATLWSAPFGRLLLEHIPMVRGASILDIGFGTGFPLIELSQRFGEPSKIYGIDIWKEGIYRTEEKIRTLEISNVEIIEGSATEIPLGDGQVDLVTSNLGVNNFEHKEDVYREIHRVLKKGGHLALTTNPIGTFEELFEIFGSILGEMGLAKAQTKLKEHIEHRNTTGGIQLEIESFGFRLSKSKSDSTNIRFVDAAALLDHSLIRIGFRASWGSMVADGENRRRFFERLVGKVNHLVEVEGEFKMTIPMEYMEFEKE